MSLKILVNSLFGGGAEIQAALLAKALKPEAFLLLDDECSPRPDLPPFLSLLHHGASLPGAIKTILSPLYASRLAALTGRGDTVLSLMERSNFVNILAARKSGHRAVICERTYPSVDFSGIRGALMKPIIRTLYPAADLIISNSKGNARDLAEKLNAPLAIIEKRRIGNDDTTETLNIIGEVGGMRALTVDDEIDTALKKHAVTASKMLVSLMGAKSDAMKFRAAKTILDFVRGPAGSRDSDYSDEEYRRSSRQISEILEKYKNKKTVGN